MVINQRLLSWRWFDFLLYFFLMVQVKFCLSRSWVVWRSRSRPIRGRCWGFTGAMMGLRYSHVRLDHQLWYFVLWFTHTHTHTHTDGEDGVVKIWSRSGMLRTILVQSGNTSMSHGITWHHLTSHAHHLTSHDLSPQVLQSTRAAGLRTQTTSSTQVGKP